MSFIANIHQRLDTLVPVSKRNKHVSFVIILFGASLDNINVMGSLSLYTSIQKYFDADTPTATWVLSAYALTLGAFIMLGGKMTDILGPKRVFLSGLGLSSLMCLICAAAENSIIVVIIFRAFQGMCAALTIPSMFPIAHSYYSRTHMANALLSILFVLTCSNGLGLVIGGAFALTDIGYKGFYYFSFGLAFAVVIVLYLTMYPVETHAENKNVSIKNLDWPGTVMIILGILLVILGLTEGGESWSKPAAYVPIPIGVLVLVFGAWFELVYIQGYKNRIDQGTAVSTATSTKADWRYDLVLLIPRESFGITNFVPLISSVIFCFISFLGLMTTTVQYLQFIDGDSPLMAGVKASPLTVGIMIAFILVKEPLIYRVGMKFVLVTSQLASVLVLVWISFTDYNRPHNYWLFIFMPLPIYALNLHAFFSTYFNAIMRNTPGHLQGAVSGMLQTIAQVGICLGNALMATLQGVMTDKPTDEQREQYAKRFKNSFYVLIAVHAAQVVCLLFVKNQKGVEMQVSDQESVISKEASIKEV